MPTETPTISISEMFGPTYQGEGPDIGKACLFIRLQHCPVQCPGCDTHYTWDGSETGTLTPMEQIAEFVKSKVLPEGGSALPDIGLVLSGGEPLLHYRNDDWFKHLRELKTFFSWTSIETSGFVGKKPVSSSVEDVRRFTRYMRCFDTIAWSPKITPCLHGKQADVDLMNNWDVLVNNRGQSKLVVKFVARDQADIDAIVNACNTYRFRSYGIPIYVMPYGIERDDVIATSKELLPACARHGFILTPRLHSLLWGPKRRV